MDDKEHINTLISVGADLPPLNPYLDDQSQSDDGGDDDANPKSKDRTGRKSSTSVKPMTTKTIVPDPKEYIAELERPEDVDILY